MNKLTFFSLLLINSITLHGMLPKHKEDRQKILSESNNNKKNDPVIDIIKNSRFTHKQGPNKNNNFTESSIFTIIESTFKSKL
jgi:hypothetical protein